MKREKHWLTLDETVAIFNLVQSNPRDEALFILLRYGLRCGEIVGRGRLPGISAEDLRADGVRLLRKNRTVEKMHYMKPAMMKRLIQLAAQFERGDDGKLFKLSYSQALRVVEGWAVKAGIPDSDKLGFGPHRLRAFFATNAHDDGLDAFTIRDMMDHKDVRTTNTYIGRSSPDHLRKAMEKLS